eukprot:scaffold2191_cov254-Pinguiococcus_pyrenoidosus.AAC.1
MILSGGGTILWQSESGVDSAARRIGLYHQETPNYDHACNGCKGCFCKFCLNRAVTGAESSR